MLFNSLDFILFFALVYAAYLLSPRRLRVVVLLAASLFFYMYWKIPYVLLLLLSGLVDFCVALAIERSTRAKAKKAFLLISLCSNLGMLGFFKYYNFFLDGLDTFALRPGWLSTTSLLLPLGISFYTFQTMSYTIDVYRGSLKAERNPLKLLTFVAFFPQLVAGPIVRASDLLPQINKCVRPTWDDFIVGGQRVMAGFIKKTVVADNVSVIVNQVYGAPDAYNGQALLIATYAFAIQIVFDFSGYSDMAIGLARMLGFRFLENFNMPYLSSSIQDFWRRWHISLSSWLRDYLYIGLGGNRHGAWATYRNLMLTMLLGGLWHGASFNFVIWGAIHGVWLAIERFYTRKMRHGTHSSTTLGTWVKTLLVFHGVCLAWIFFRAPSFHDAWQTVTGIFMWTDGLSLRPFEVVYALGLTLLGALFLVGFFKLKHYGSWAKGALFAYGLTCVIVFGSTGQDFIYFVF